MLYAWIDGERRSPRERGERTTCRDCGGVLSAVIPVENVRHWRHQSGDCDSWSEPEGPWHIGWKEAFPLTCREVGLIDEVTGERHRADILVGRDTPNATVLELQHSSIPDHELAARESFYRRDHRMFWLVHIHNENSFNGYSFSFSLDFSRAQTIDGRHFSTMRWMGRSRQFIEKWKRANAHVFFDFGGRIYFLAGEQLSRRLSGGRPLTKGEFALCELTREHFLQAVARA